MFVEPSNRRFGHENGTGWIEVVCGSMFSGKTEELIRRLNRAFIAQQRVEIFKPVIDKRYSKEKIVSHNENEIHSTKLGTQRPSGVKWAWHGETAQKKGKIHELEKQE